jgi:aspartyl-tRNA(Asn)/glutamyl-tRNA(Gln) amidotransferase subunit C
MTREEVVKLAKLARIAVPDEELDALAGEIDAILGYVSDVQRIADGSAGIQDSYDLTNVMRDDVVLNQPGEYTERIVAQFPNKEGKLLKVQKIL